MCCGQVCGQSFREVVTPGLNRLNVVSGFIPAPDPGFTTLLEYFRSNSSCLEEPLIPPNRLIVILLNKLSMMFSQDACLGVNTN